MHNTRMFDFSSFPVLTTERLVLRQLHLSDAADVLIFRSDPHVQRYNGPVYESVADAQTSIREAHTEYEKREGLTWAVTLRQEDRAIGHFGFHSLNHYHRRAEVGYDLARAYWGQRIASEALRAILHFGFERLNLNTFTRAPSQTTMSPSAC